MLNATGVTKRFGGVLALRGVDFTLAAGEVHGLLGENGAGKSTLMKILAGVHRPDEGMLCLGGRPLSLRDPKHAHDEGIRIVYQELSLVPDLTVAENLFLHRFAAGGVGLVGRKSLHREAERLLGQWELDIPSQARVARLPMGQRQLVEIAREVAREGKVLILDEPTSSLTNREIDRLFAVLARLKAAGMGIVFISHRLNEVMRVADRVTVLRNGRKVATRATAEVTPAEVVALIVGRELEELYPKLAAELGEVVLEAKDLTGPGFRGVSFALRRGEILGVAGLNGAGRSELLRCLFGVNPPTAGEAWLEGRRLAARSPREAMAAGLALLPEGRGDEGIVPLLTVGQNLILANLAEVSSPGGVLKEGRVKAKVAGLVAELSVATYDPHRQLVSQLSGGNQQKVVLGRLLGAHPRVLLLDEPTRGVDVGTKAEIHKLMGRFVARGNAIVAVSSDLPELVGVCDRILVLRRGGMAGFFRREEFSEEEILRCAMGLSQN